MSGRQESYVNKVGKTAISNFNTVELFPYYRHNLTTESVQQQIIIGDTAGVIQQEMGMSIQTQSPRTSDYAPLNSNPLRLASTTIKAVDQLGLTTSDEIERTADEIMQGATEIATKLRELATAIREHTEIASEQVAGFCDRATSVFEGVVELQQKLALNGHKLAANGHETAADADDGEALELPEFMKKGPAGDDSL